MEPIAAAGVVPFPTSKEDEMMASSDDSRPIGNTPITDAAAAASPEDGAKYGSNADLRVAEDDELRDAAVSATGADIDNDHADERPFNRSDDAPEAQNSAQVQPNDTQDVVDHMNQMQQSGQIDMDAYRGERNDDDQTDALGVQGLDPDDIDEHGNKAHDG